MKQRIKNSSADDELEYLFYKAVPLRQLLVWMMIILSCGILYLIFYWKPTWRFLLTHKQSKRKDADAVFIKLLDGTDRVFSSHLEYVSNSSAKTAPYLFSTVGMSKENFLDLNGVMTFSTMKRKYVWNEKEKNFVEITGIDRNIKIGDLIRMADTGLDINDRRQLQEIYGENIIDVEVPSYFALFVIEVLNPFYVFQLLTCALWIAEQFIYYSVMLLVMSLASAIVSLIQVRRERQDLHDMVHQHNRMKVSLYDRHNDTKEVWATDLVPGDVVCIPKNGLLLSFDAVLISGDCSVNESMLTGEGIPVTKTKLHASAGGIYSSDNHKQHTLFCGTTVLQARNSKGHQHVNAVVTRTGFSTAKGKLVQSIMFPKPTDHQAVRDARKFLLFLFSMATCGAAYTIIVQVHFGMPASDIIWNTLDIMTFAVPPMLFLAITIGILYAQGRLKKVGIHCISPHNINIAGQTNLVVFDKTGTLTEETLDFDDFVQVDSEGGFTKHVQGDNNNIEGELLYCMAACHCLVHLDDTLIGDSLEVKMFEKTQWKLLQGKESEETKVFVENNHNAKERIEILQRFPFASKLQRSSVLTRKTGNDTACIYTKGAPEKIAGLCVSQSIPEDFSDVLESFTSQGKRVIALAWRSIEYVNGKEYSQNEIENDLTFLGFITFENKLKPSTKGTLEQLKGAGIRVLMATGDNLETAISVAKNCGLISPNMELLVGKTKYPTESSLNYLRFPNLQWKLDKTTSDHGNSIGISFDKIEDLEKVAFINKSKYNLALTGNDYKNIKEYFPEYLPAVLTKGAIFARMSPQQKSDLVEDLKGIDYFVAMCGDGANDCGALKTAHTGISVSDYEASVAAPFTARTSNGISSVAILMREARAALVTSLGMFKFITVSSMIMFTTTALLYYRLSIFSDIMYLYIDLFALTLITTAMPRNMPYKKLHPVPPTTSLVAPEMLISMIVQTVLQIFFQVFVYYETQHQCWYTPSNQTASLTHETHTHYTIENCSALADVPFQKEDHYNSVTYETTALFFVTTFMYIGLSVAMSRGPPYRTIIFENTYYIVCLLGITILTVCLMFYAPLSVDNFFAIRQIPNYSYLLKLLACAAVYFVVSLLFEIVFIEHKDFWTSKIPFCKQERYLQHFKINAALDGKSGDSTIKNPWIDRNKRLISSEFTDFRTNLMM